MSRKVFSAICLPLIFLWMLVGSTLAFGQIETVLHTFQSTNKYDGANPFGGLVTDGTGAFYGTTFNGGKYGFGSVYKLALVNGTWTQSILYSFTGLTDGAGPTGNLLFNTTNHHFYGTATVGGGGTGVVYELTPGKPWTEAVIHAFAGGNDGANPQSGVISDGKGTLYGTTPSGGADQYGTVFRLSPQSGGTWKETVLYSFTGGGTDALNPYGGLVRDASGVFYGATLNGGTNNLGAVFALNPPTGGIGPWTESVLYSFAGATDGANPEGTLVFDKNGALYGTTTAGGTGGAQCGCGVIFKLTPPIGGTGPWTEHILYTFTGGADGSSPYAGLIFDTVGALYGTAQYGGDNTLRGCGVPPAGVNGCGVVFKLSPPAGGRGGWTEHVLHTFELGSDGGYSLAPLLQNGTSFYGTSFLGGGTKNLGIVFQIAP